MKTIKFKYYTKQLIKLSIHLVLFGFIGASMIWGSIIVLTDNENWFTTTGAIFEILLYISFHSLVGWLLEKTPLKTKRLKERMENIKDEKTINKGKE